MGSTEQAWDLVLTSYSWIGTVHVDIPISNKFKANLQIVQGFLFFSQCLAHMYMYLTTKENVLPQVGISISLQSLVWCKNHCWHSIEEEEDKLIGKVNAFVDEMYVYNRKIKWQALTLLVLQHL